MTVDPNSIDLAQVMTEHLERAEPDLLRDLLKVFVQALMSQDADAACGAPYGSRSAERTNARNGYRPALLQFGFAGSGLRRTPPRTCRVVET